MSPNLDGKFWKVANRLFDDGEKDLPSEKQQETSDDLLVMVDTAKQEWLNAQNYFNHATEPELVDHAIVSLQAAESKYMYWLKQLKNSR